jgi:carbonyl reductase 1
LLLHSARSEEKGKNAIDKLEKEGYKPHFHQLDVESIQSIKEFSRYIKENYQGIDILINNAGVLDFEVHILYLSYRNHPLIFNCILFIIWTKFNFKNKKSVADKAKETISINFFGTLNVCREFFPLLRSNARVVNVSSRYGLLRLLKNNELKNKLSDDNDTIDDIVKVMENYVTKMENVM